VTVSLSGSSFELGLDGTELSEEDVEWAECRPGLRISRLDTSGTARFSDCFTDVACLDLPFLTSTVATFALLGGGSTISGFAVMSGALSGITVSFRCERDSFAGISSVL